MVCAAKGYPFVATMVETFSMERRKIMRAFGAKVILTPKEERGTGMVRKVFSLEAGVVADCCRQKNLQRPTGGF